MIRSRNDKCKAKEFIQLFTLKWYKASVRFKKTKLKVLHDSEIQPRNNIPKIMAGFKLVLNLINKILKLQS